MEPEWIVRVGGKEFGPVDLDDLAEWKAEGRLIRTNEVRRTTDENWRVAGEVPELFPASAKPSAPPVQHRSLFTIIAESVRIYTRAFPQFFCLALMVAIPSLVMQVSLAFVDISENAAVTQQSKLASAIAIVAMVILLVIWPIFLAGLQFGTAEVMGGRPFRLREVLQRAVSFWPRVARLSVVVYASYIFWTLIPVLAIFALIAGTPNLLVLFLALLIMAFQVYITGRLFVNYLFWQQTSTLGGLEGGEALRKSKDLARSGTSLSRMQRPLYLGAALASLWLLLLLAFSSAAELPFMIIRLKAVTNLADAMALLQTLRNAPTPDALAFGSYALSSLVHAVLRPLLGISFVVLYQSARGAVHEEQPALSA